MASLAVLLVLAVFASLITGIVAHHPPYIRLARLGVFLSVPSLTYTLIYLGFF